MLRRLALRDFAIVREVEVEFGGGFSVLSGETGAGKSILVDALQLALGSRGDAGVVREGASRSEVSAEFDPVPALAGWLDEAGFAQAESLLLRRTIDKDGRSRAWINGSAATVAQLREVADHVVDIHGQHAWQSLTRPQPARTLLDREANVDAVALAELWSRWRKADAAAAGARGREAELSRERERLLWQINEIETLGPGTTEWDELNAEHQRLSNAQSLLEAARAALDAIGEADANALGLTGRAASALDGVARYDTRLVALVDVLRGAEAQLNDVVHTLGAYLNRGEPEPERLAHLDQRLAAWIGLARRHRRAPADLPRLLAEWNEALRALDAAADVAALERTAQALGAAFEAAARDASRSRKAAVPRLSRAVTDAMQQLGMAGGRFDVVLVTESSAQSFGFESVEFHVAGHAGSTPRPLARIASGGELSRIALAVATVTSSRAEASAGTLIFDEVDAGVGGAVAEVVGRLMKRLGDKRQVLAVTHLPQVAACADQHWLVTKSTRDGSAATEVERLDGEARVAEVARMLAGERLSGTSIAHATEMLAIARETSGTPRTRPKKKA